jgi:hypothetical protein
MGNRKYVLLALRWCEGCGELFRPQRRNQTYHNQACKQTAYDQRTKRNKNVLRNALVLPVLSLFPGIGLLDRAFEECGFMVVRGPDLLWEMTFETFTRSQDISAALSAGLPARCLADCAILWNITAISSHRIFLASRVTPERNRTVSKESSLRSRSREDLCTRKGASFSAQAAWRGERVRRKILIVVLGSIVTREAKKCCLFHPTLS